MDPVEPGMAFWRRPLEEIEKEPLVSAVEAQRQMYAEAAARARETSGDRPLSRRVNIPVEDAMVRLAGAIENGINVLKALKAAREAHLRGEEVGEPIQGPPAPVTLTDLRRWTRQAERQGKPLAIGDSAPSDAPLPYTPLEDPLLGDLNRRAEDILRQRREREREENARAFQTGYRARTEDLIKWMQEVTAYSLLADVRHYSEGKGVPIPYLFGAQDEAGDAFLFFVWSGPVEGMRVVEGVLQQLTNMVGDGESLMPPVGNVSEFGRPADEVRNDRPDRGPEPPRWTP